MPRPISPPLVPRVNRATIVPQKRVRTAAMAIDLEKARLAQAKLLGVATDPRCTSAERNIASRLYTDFEECLSKVETYGRHLLARLAVLETSLAKRDDDEHKPKNN
jgi:hypothetical protein